MYTCPCTAHPIPPLRGVISQELNEVVWPVPFPLRTAHSQATMKCITRLKLCSTNLIYIHHHKPTIIIYHPVSWRLEEKVTILLKYKTCNIFKEMLKFMHLEGLR
jgi:hypothetical protein